MRRPAIPFALSLAAGIAAGRFGHPLLPILAALAAALVAVALALSGRGRARSAVPLLAVVAAGLASGEVLEWRHYRVFGADHIQRHAAEPGPAVLTGVIAGEPTFRAADHLRYASFRLDVESIERAGRIEPASGAVSVYIWRTEPLAALAGDRVRLVGVLARPRGPTNPGEVDRRPALADERVHAVLTVGREGEVEVCERGRGLRAALARLKARLRAALLAAVPGEPGAFLDSILLGTRNALPEDVLEDFRRTGTVHMLVVSGQHLTLLAALVWAVLSLAFRLPAKVATVATLVFSVLYCALTGGEPSIVRATIMVAIYLLGCLVRREADGLNSLALAAAAILAVSPGSLMNVGFQLSFAAILGLDLLGKPACAAFAGLLPEVGARAGLGRRAILLGARWAGGAAIASGAAWIATAPLILWKFHIVTPGLVLSNLAAAAVCAAVLYSGFALLAIAPVSQAAAAPIAWFAGNAAEAFMGLMHWLARVPGAYAYVPDVGGERVALAYLAIAGAAAALASRRPAGRPLVRGALAAASVAAAVAVLVPAGPRDPGAGRASVAVLDVGSGLATAVRTSGGTVLVDCGGRRVEPGLRVIAPYLWREGVRRIDAIFLSHGHADHMNAVEDLAERFAIGGVYVGPWFRESPGGRRLVARLRARGIRVETLAAGRRLAPAPGIGVDVLAPSGSPDDGGRPAPRARRGDPPPPRYDGQNDTSLVLRLRAGGRRVLFTGDIEEDGIALLAGSGADLEADLVLIPHHGARNECLEDLAALATPAVAVASARRGAADPASLAAFEKYGARVLETGAGGAVLVDLSPTAVAARTFLGRDRDPAEGRPVRGKRKPAPDATSGKGRTRQGGAVPAGAGDTPRAGATVPAAAGDDHRAGAAPAGAGDAPRARAGRRRRGADAVPGRDGAAASGTTESAERLSAEADDLPPRARRRPLPRRAPEEVERASECGPGGEEEGRREDGTSGRRERSRVLRE